MRIITLVENTEGTKGCGAEHGLSLYVETEKHSLLMDTGASSLFLQNAEILGVDPEKVDTVILSHGHFDHGGGIPAFAKINPRAKIWLQRTAFGEFYSRPEGQEGHYIGLDPAIRDLEQLAFAGDVCRIDEELTIFSAIGTAWPLPPTNHALKEKGPEGMVPEDFRHEQCLVIREKGKIVLFSGCAHHGMLNILDRYRALFQEEPDVVISGFHMMKKRGYEDRDIRFITETAAELNKTRPIYYTGHCTGVEPYQMMKEIMGDKIRYLHTGDELTV